MRTPSYPTTVRVTTTIVAVQDVLLPPNTKDVYKGEGVPSRVPMYTVGVRGYLTE